MSSNASAGSPLVKPKLYRTASMSAIMQAEQQDRFLQLGELNEIVAFLNSGSKRLEIANVISNNSNLMVSKAADKIFVGGSPISYLEKPQASFLDSNESSKQMSDTQAISISGDVVSGFSSNIFNAGDILPPGFKPINVVRYGSTRMQKSLRDLDWFLRYLTYAIVAGDTNILSVNIRGLRELIDNACSSAAASVALREMRKVAVTLFDNDSASQELVKEYFNVIINEFDQSRLSDKLRKRASIDLQGLKLPQSYAMAGILKPKFVMKSSLSADEKNTVVKACYRQVFERDIAKAYNIQFSGLESQVKTGQLSIKEFVRALGKSSIYRQQFHENFVDSRVVELSFKHFLGRGISSLEEFQKYFAILSSNGLYSLIDSLLNSLEYSDYFGEETVPYFRDLGQEAQESKNWGAQIALFNYSAVFRKKPQFITLFSDYQNNLPDQHAYGLTNDPLVTQFGAIFPVNLFNLTARPAFFGRDTRRILLRFGPGIYNQLSNPKVRAQVLPCLGPRIFSFKANKSKKNIVNLDQLKRAVYLRIFGRFLYSEELVCIKKFEEQFCSGKCSVRDFVRSLAKSSVFRALYWQPLYICKAIEYIHVRLLGRPTYGRQEIDQYFNIVYKEGYYTMIDRIIDSREYTETFGSSIVPYERYLTSNTLISRKLGSNSVHNNRSLKGIDSNNLANINQSVNKDNRNLSIFNLKQRVSQGVTSRRDQLKIFEFCKEKNQPADTYQILRAIYRQVFERDINTFTVGDEFHNLEKAFLLNEITVQEVIEYLGCSKLYTKEFYQPYPNTKVIELGTKHFLGRAPSNQAEIRYYNQILASQGQVSFIKTLVNSIEYTALFGKNIVPYHRFPTLPAANFPNTQKLYNSLLKQSTQIIVPSFGNSVGNQ
uniref:Phycobiliprotein ApcE n=1 Tax=Griffithsia pacifica TaxID=35689 RepID=A0A291FED9_GRIPA|nr:LCM [Griffithsia pacifica]5Y6P_a2 Chain a2, LCM [Griffithsia pacifica]5Y6P_b2 Chain b2, LCM [Griffithsia pacifica]